MAASDQTVSVCSIEMEIEMKIETKTRATSITSNYFLIPEYALRINMCQLTTICLPCTADIN